jgi:hypothetical protein
MTSFTKRFDISFTLSREPGAASLVGYFTKSAAGVCSARQARAAVPTGLIPRLHLIANRAPPLSQDDSGSGEFWRMLRSWFPAGRESRFALTQGLRPGLSYVAPSGLGWGDSVCHARAMVAGSFSRERRRALLGWTAEGGCPHVFGRPDLTSRLKVQRSFVGSRSRATRLPQDDTVGTRHAAAEIRSISVVCGLILL